MVSLRFKRQGRLLYCALVRRDVGEEEREGEGGRGFVSSSGDGWGGVGTDKMS